MDAMYRSNGSATGYCVCVIVVIPAPLAVPFQVIMSIPRRSIRANDKELLLMLSGERGLIKEGLGSWPRGPARG